MRPQAIDHSTQLWASQHHGLLALGTTAAVGVAGALWRRSR